MATYFTPDDAIILLDNTVGSLTDYSEYISTVKFEVDVKTGTFPVLGKPFEITAEGTRTIKGTITFKSSVDTAGLLYNINNWLLGNTAAKVGQKSLRIQTPDAAAGSFQWDMEIRPGTTSLVDAKAGEAVPAEYSLPFIADVPTYTVIT